MQKDSYRRAAPLENLQALPGKTAIKTLVLRVDVEVLVIFCPLSVFLVKAFFVLAILLEGTEISLSLPIYIHPKSSRRRRPRRNLSTATFKRCPSHCCPSINSGFIYMHGKNRIRQPQK
jgi:hypothetical protein